MKEQSKRITMDPRTGLALLVLANIITLVQDSIYVEFAWIVALGVLTMFYGKIRSGVKWLFAFVCILLIQQYVLPATPKFLAAGFFIITNYARKLYPCMMIGNLMIKTLSLRSFIVGLRKLHVPQKLIIPISVTLRYFPAIKEETGHIRDAMRLRNISGIDKVEAFFVPLMISATETAQELSAAAVTRGIENPVKKTSVVELHMGAGDFGVLIVATAFMIAALVA